MTFPYKLVVYKEFRKPCNFEKDASKKFSVIPIKKNWATEMQKTIVFLQPSFVRTQHV